jgi:hypothetical protein
MGAAFGTTLSPDFGPMPPTTWDDNTPREKGTPFVHCIELSMVDIYCYPLYG